MFFSAPAPLVPRSPCTSCACARRRLFLARRRRPEHADDGRQPAATVDKCCRCTRFCSASPQQQRGVLPQPCEADGFVWEHLAAAATCPAACWVSGRPAGTIADARDQPAARRASPGLGPRARGSSAARGCWRPELWPGQPSHTTDGAHGRGRRCVPSASGNRRVVWIRTWHPATRIATPWKQRRAERRPLLPPRSAAPAAGRLW